MGLDIGKLTDHAAFAIVERRAAREAHQPEARKPAKLAVRYLHRMPLAAAHSATIQHACQLLASDMLRGAVLAVDATGKGEPVLEALRASTIQQRIIGVTFTSGRAGKQTGTSDFTVPKNRLIGTLARAAATGQLQIPRDLPAAAELCHELSRITTRITKAGHIRTGADGSGEHDDLAVAAALAAWTALNIPGNGPDAS